MERTPEPEVMDDPGQALAYAEADFAEVNQSFVDALVASLPNAEKLSQVLDLGCGPADIPLRLCQRLPQIQVMGIDASEPMVSLGRNAIEQAQLNHRMELRVAWLPVDPIDRSFDLIISNSLLHHLPDPSVLWNQIARQIALAENDGVEIYIMDLRRPADPASAQKIVDTYAENEPDILRRDFYNSLLAAFTPEEVQTQLEEAGLGHLKVNLPSDRHLLVTGRVV